MKLPDIDDSNQYEAQIHMQCIEYMRWSYPDFFRPRSGKICFHVANQRANGAIEGAKLKKMGQRAGVWDILLFWNNDFEGHKTKMAGCIEIKTTKGYLSPSQKEFGEDWECIGFKKAIARSTEDIDKIMQDWGHKPLYSVPLAKEKTRQQMKQAAWMDWQKP